ncbi:cryptochrome/photolyase family protein [Hwanghaeella sp.]|uniref:cryptochrome/photolyase family protein n=1 Tax=Hwanghaeella sp. TaxID=2605943 RepID=UPI003CCC234B
MSKTLILILGDQVSAGISSLRAAPPADAVVLMAEVGAEATYVKHHKKKIALIFSAMRHFAEDLRAQGWTVDYVALDDPDNTGSLRSEVRRALDRHACDRIAVTEPGEWRLRTDMTTWSDSMAVPVDIREDDRFIAGHAEFDAWAEGRKQLRMEYFYREMRRKTGLLMTADGEPEGGRWNFDAENRKPAKADLFMPRPSGFEPDTITQSVLALVQDRFPDHFGDLVPFWFPVTAAQAEEALDSFIDKALPYFGDYQDAMLTEEKFLYHSVLSPAINIGLLDPLDVCRRAEAAYKDGKAPLNAVEGFIRQIIGWREFIRGIYWWAGADYVEGNALGARRDLPWFYWSGDTEMNCIRETVKQTREEAYAHHIQRLMVTGTFALLAGVDPRQIHEWYLSVYADAFEWVELPNTLGMSQFADGGLVASKPYAASGAYIDKMSDYCGHCRFDVKRKNGEGACPFNFLYWDFIARNEEKLKGNPRLGPVYRTWHRMKQETRDAHRSSAARFLDSLS